MLHPEEEAAPYYVGTLSDILKFGRFSRQRLNKFLIKQDDLISRWSFFLSEIRGKESAS
jgi:hypothetical protein